MQRVFASKAGLFKLTAYVILVLMLAGTTILYLSNYKLIIVYADNSTYHHFSLADSVGHVLQEMGLELRTEDYVFPSRDSSVGKWTSVAIVRAKPFTIAHDGIDTEVFSVGPKVADVLLDAGLSWQEQDLIIPSAESPVPGDKQITLVRISIELYYKTVTLPHAVQRIANDSLYRGQERLVQSGRDGQEGQIIQVVYHDDQAVEKNLISSKILVNTKDKVLESGTISSINRGGLEISISRVFDVLSTAYCSGMPGSGCPVDEKGYSQCTGKATGYTATGRKAIQGSGTRDDPYIIAVDPRMISLGTLCYLSFRGGGVTTRHGRIITDGFAIAADTGSAIKGNRVDILFDDHWVAWYFGRRRIQVFVVEGVKAK